MKLSPAGLEFIKRFEQFKAKPYDDGYGYLTIGYGHRIVEGEVFTEISEPYALNMLKEDIEKREKKLAPYIAKLSLTQGQYDAVISFVFNVGVTAFLESTLYKSLCAKLKFEAALEFQRWHHSGGKDSRGLLIRRMEEALVFLKDWN